MYNSLLHSFHTHKMWKRSVEKYKSYGILSTTTYLPSVFCEVGVVQLCKEAQAGVVQDGLRPPRKSCKNSSKKGRVLGQESAYISKI